MDCLVVNVRENQRVITKALYLVLGVDLNGQKELLGMGIAQSEGAKFWLSVLTELQNRGVKDLFIACVHGASGEELLALGVVQAHESSRDRPQSHLLSQH